MIFNMKCQTAGASWPSLPLVKMHPVDSFGNEEAATFFPTGVEALLLKLEVQILAHLGQPEIGNSSIKNSLFFQEKFMFS